MSVRTAGLIIIGNEILSGRVKDENIYFLCTRFLDLGIKVDKIVTVGDYVKDIAEEVSEFTKNFDIVITSGGVGPTHDDVTYEGVAAAFGLPMIINQELVNFWKCDPSETHLSVSKMSTVPQSSKIVYSSLPESEKIPVVQLSNIFMFPGTPKLLQKRFNGLEKYFNDGGTTFFKREIYLCVDEYIAISALNQTVNKFPDVQIGSYPEINNSNYATRLTLHSHLLQRVVEACDMLTSLLDPLWVLNPNSFKHKNKL